MIVIDLSATQASKNSKFHGGGEYAKEVVYKIIKMGFVDFIGLYDKEYELDSTILDYCKQHDIKLIAVNGQKGIVDYVNSSHPELYYSALPYEQTSIDTSKTRFIMTIHGLREIECPYDPIQMKYLHTLKDKIKLIVKRLFFSNRTSKIYKNKFLKLVDKKNTKIITVSEHTKYSLCSIYPFLNRNDIFVSPAPCPFGSETLRKPAEFVSKEILEKGFFLLVSGNRWMKNNYRAMRAIANFYSKNPGCTIKTVVTGIDKIPSEFSQDDRFVFLNYIEADSLNWLYKNAFCFIYPTLNEGYGYPPLQAMIYGTPVLASAVSSIPEVCGNNVLYFDPHNVLEIENRITYLYSEKYLYKKLSIEGMRHAQTIKDNKEQNLENIVNFIFSDTNRS